MKKFVLFAIFATTLFAFSTSCSKDKESGIESYPSIIGSWNDISKTDGEYVSIEAELIWTFNPNNNGTTRIIMTVNGSVMRDVSSNFTYDYKGNYILIKNSETTLNYSISVSGNKMRLGNDENGYFNLTKK